LRKFRSRLFLTRTENKKTMMLDDQYSEELRALRNLERAVRAYGLTTQMVSVQRRREMLAAALREVVEARKAAIRRSRRIASP
jgi:hypothetical protein